MKKMYDRKKLEEQSIDIKPHNYLIRGLRSFNNMKDLRMTP